MLSENEIKLEFSEYVIDFLKKADKNLRRKLIVKIEFLRKNFDQIPHLSLSYEFRDFFKFRVGQYRIIYNFDIAKNTLRIVLIAKRDQVYKILKRKIINM